MPAKKKDTPTQTGPVQVVTANHMLRTAFRSHGERALFSSPTKRQTQHAMETNPVVGIETIIERGWRGGEDPVVVFACLADVDVKGLEN